MALRLILMRHAKSGWGDDDTSDHDRVLNPRGRAACDVIGPWLFAQGIVPDQVLCSDAARTQETWGRLAPYMPAAPQPDIRGDLYLANASKLLSVVKSAAGRTVALVAHNPGIGDLASGLLTARPAHPQFGQYPTLATLIAEFDIDSWADLKPQTGRAVRFIVPRDLTD